MRGKTVIITGATGAIGKALTEYAVECKAEKVIMACRDLARAGKIAEEIGAVETEIEVIELNLDKFESVRNFVKEISDKGLIIDGLFNNAGAMPKKLIETEDGNELATQVNYLAPVMLTRLLYQCFSENAFVVMTTSVTRKVFKLHGENPVEWNKRHFSIYGTYGRSKRLLTEVVPSLNDEMKEKKIRVNCADPGVVNSRMINVNRVIDPIANIFFRPFIRTPKEGAKPLIEASEAEERGYVFTSGGKKIIKGIL